MQISDRVLARRYARALFLSAKGAGAQEKTGAELGEAVKKLVPAMAAYKNPRTSAKDKKARLSKDLGKPSPMVARFLEILIDKKRFTLLAMMNQDYARLYDEDRGVAHAKVRAAHELSDDERLAIAERLGKFTGKKIVLDVKHHPELIAGVEVRMGDWVFDATLKGELKRMRGRIAA